MADRSDRPVDAEWVRATAQATQGVTLSAGEAAELAPAVQRLLDALDALAPQRGFNDEPPRFLRALQRHKQGATP